MKKALLLKSALALAMAAPMMASAESQLVTSGSAQANLDFRVIIPRVLFLGVGAGANTVPPVNNTAVNLVTFDYTTNPGSVGAGAGAPAAVITGAVVPVRVIGTTARSF